MGLFSQFPITNFHELNLDWIVKAVKDYIQKFGQLETEFNALEMDVEAFKQYVTNYLSELNISEEVTESVNAWMNENMTNDMLATLIRNSTLLLGRNITPKRILRLAEATTRNLAAYDNTLKNHGQGFCLTPNGYMIALTNTEMYNNNADIIELDSSKQIVRQFTIPAGHANALAYSNDRLYVAPLYYNAGGARSNTTDLLVYDYNDLSLLETITCVTVPHSVSVENDIIYFTNNVSTTVIDLYKIESGVQSKIASFIRPENATYQNAVVKNGNIYLVYFNSNMIQAYNIASGELLAYFNIPKNTTEGFTVGELEAMDIDGSDIYIMSVVGQRINPAYYYTQIFKFNVNVGNDDLGVRTQPTPIYKTITAGTVNTYGDLNPDGSADKPFPTLDEGMISAHAQNCTAVHLRGDMSESVLYVYGPMNVKGYNRTSTKVNSLYAEDAQAVVLNLQMINNKADSYMNYVVNSDVFIDYCTINNQFDIPTLQAELSKVMITNHCTITNNTQPRYFNFVNSYFGTHAGSFLVSNAIVNGQLLTPLEFSVTDNGDGTFTVSDAAAYAIANRVSGHVRLYADTSNALASVEMFLNSTKRNLVNGAGYVFSFDGSTFTWAGDTITRSSGSTVLSRLLII